MASYQDHEIIKRDIKLKEREYFNKKEDLQKLKRTLLKDINNYEVMFGKTDEFNAIKFENSVMPQHEVKNKKQKTYGDNYEYNTKPIVKKESAFTTILKVLLVIILSPIAVIALYIFIALIQQLWI